MVRTTATEQRLQSRPWRLGHSVWTLWAVLGMGLLTWVGFTYIAVRARSWTWFAMAAVWCGYFLFGMTAFPPTLDAAWGSVALVAWILGMIHTYVTLPKWWRWRAEQGGSNFGMIDRSATPAAPSAVAATGWPADAAGWPADAAGWPADAARVAAPPAQPPPDQVAPPPPPPPASWQTSGQPTTSPRTPLSLGSVIPGLGVVDDIPEDGHGSFGTVYRVRRDFDGKHVAGKVFRVQQGLNGDREADRALRDEMAALESLQHRNIVRVMNPVRLSDQGSWILVSEWVDGTTLETATMGIEPLSDERVFKVGPQLLDAVCYLEEVGVVHRDIEPTNVMLDSAGTVKLIDFNLTRVAGRETAIAGTRPYLPPDYLLDGNSVDALVDRFAVGVILFELLTHKHPYVEYAHAAVPVLPNSTPADPRAFRPDLSADMVAFLARSVEPREASRFSSAAEMRAAWVVATTSNDSSRPEPTAPRGPQPPASTARPNPA